MTSNNYFYTREKADGLWNIDNPLRVDINNNQIHLAKEVEEALPGKLFSLYMAKESVVFAFTEALSEADKVILDTCVSVHKNNE